MFQSTFRKLATAQKAFFPRHMKWSSIITTEASGDPLAIPHLNDNLADVHETLRNDHYDLLVDKTRLRSNHTGQPRADAFINNIFTQLYGQGALTHPVALTVATTNWN